MAAPKRNPDMVSYFTDFLNKQATCTKSGNKYVVAERDQRKALVDQGLTEEIQAKFAEVNTALTEACFRFVGEKTVDRITAAVDAKADPAELPPTVLTIATGVSLNETSCTPKKFTRPGPKAEDKTPKVVFGHIRQVIKTKTTVHRLSDITSEVSETVRKAMGE